MPRLFQQQSIGLYFTKYRDSILASIDRMPENQLLKLDIDKFMKGSFIKDPLETPVIGVGNHDPKIVTEENTPYESVVYTIPYTGNQELLLCSPMPPVTIDLVQADVKINDQNIVMTLSNRNILTKNPDNLKRMKETHDRHIGRINHNLSLIDADVTRFKGQIQNIVRKRIEDRIKSINDRRNSEGML